jgi:tRNA U34 5-methylaminomethyl-2-thiouridine-forming methyltransferase MnmC
VWTKLNYPDDNRVLFESLHRASWGEPVSVTQYFTIDKRKVSLQDFASQSSHNVIFFDAFAPSVQPEMWTYEMLRKVTESLSADGVFVTYSAKGQLKRDLRALGLRVEAVPGPAGKREMVRAVQRLPS